MNRTLKIFLLVFLIIIIGFLAFLLFSLAFNTVTDSDKIIPGILSLFTAFIPLAIKELRDIFIAKKDKEDTTIKEFANIDSFDIFIYGHSGSGKTTMIQRLFTRDTTPLESTPSFDYYEIPNLLDLRKKEWINIRIADYKGQDVNQLLDAARRNEKINTLWLIADIAPAYDGKNSLSEQEVYDLFKENHKLQIENRLKDHNEYLSKFLLQVVFREVYNPSLMYVRFIISKIDILEKLQNDNIISKEINLDTYVKDFFQDKISQITEFCKANNIDFKVVTGSVKPIKNFDVMLNTLLVDFKEINNQKVRKNGK